MSAANAVESAFAVAGCDSDLYVPGRLVCFEETELINSRD